MTVYPTATNTPVHFEAVLAFVYKAPDPLSCDFLEHDYITKLISLARTRANPRNTWWEQKCYTCRLVCPSLTLFFPPFSFFLSFLSSLASLSISCQYNSCFFFCFFVCFANFKGKMQILTELLKQTAYASSIPYIWATYFLKKQERGFNVTEQRKDRLAAFIFEIGGVGVGQLMMREEVSAGLLCKITIWLENGKSNPAFLSLFHYLQYHTWKNTKRSRLKRIASGWLFLSILYFYSFVLLSFNLIPNYLHCFGGMRTGCLGNITHISPSVFSVNSFQHLCVATGRMWVPFQIQMSRISPSSGWQHHAFVKL